ncbi:MAG: hypothetical protein AAGF97_01200 [Planctomycetota bacterium]
MDEDVKQKVMVSAIVFSAIVFLYQIILNSNPFSFPKLMLGVVVAAAIGGATYGVMHYLENR